MKTTHLLSVLALAATATAAQALPNPASVFCANNGGKSMILSDASGNQVGYCKLNRAMIEEWTLYHSATFGITNLNAVDAYLDHADWTMPAIANPASLYCGEVGGTSELLKDSAGNQYGGCVFNDSDGSTSSIEEWTLYRGPKAAGNTRLTQILNGNGIIGSSRP